MIRGCVWGAWRWLCDHGHLSRAEGRSALFDELEDSYQTIGVADPERIARAWLAGGVQQTLDLGSSR